MEFDELEGRFCSVLIRGRDDKNETYMGKVKVFGNFLEVVPQKNGGQIEKFLIRKDQVLSVWLYKNGKE